MVKMLFIMAKEETSMLLKFLDHVGVKRGNLIFHKFTTQTDSEKIQNKIRKERPRLIFIDGEIDPILLENIYSDIMKTIFQHDIEYDIYSYNEPIRIKFVGLSGHIRDFSQIVEMQKKFP